jgi:SAM-dependent methyltransferase
MTERVDFSRNVNVYDRRHGTVLPHEAARRLVSVAGFSAGARILDVGAGTGRITIPLAGAGCRVVGVDVGPSMLQAMGKKAAGLPVRLVAGDGVQLPFATGSFDAVVLASLLYLVPDWRALLGEAIRVARPGGSILHEWGNGSADEAWVQIREKARALFEEAGAKDPFHPGARVEADVDQFLTGRGLVRSGQVRMDPDVQMTLAGFLDLIADGECSYTWNVSEEIQRTCLPSLRQWAEERFDLKLTIPFPLEARWTIYRTRGTPLYLA